MTQNNLGMRFKRSASGRAGRRVLRRRLRPIARRFWNGRASVSRCNWAMTQNNLGTALRSARRAGGGDGQSEGLLDAEDGAGSLCGGAGGISEGGRELLCGGGARQCCAARWRHRAPLRGMRLFSSPRKRQRRYPGPFQGLRLFLIISEAVRGFRDDDDWRRAAAPAARH